MSASSMFITADDLIPQGIVPQGKISSMAMASMGEVKEGVDYHHPAGLKVRYVFTKAVDKAPIPTDAPPEGQWWVLKRLPTGVYFYELQDKPAATTTDSAATEFAKAAARALIQQPAAAASALAPAPPKSNTGLYVGLGIGGLIVAGGVYYFFLRGK